MTLNDLTGFDLSRPSHAYMVVSPNLISSREYALSIASTFICENPKKQSYACGVCKACKKSFSENHPDIMVLGRKPVSVNDVRELKERAYLAPNESDKKIFVLENIEKFNIQSQNALLKLLEEPPKNVIFVLTATSKSAVLPTVLSRVTVLTPKKHDYSYCLSAVKDAYGSADDEIIEFAASYIDMYDGTTIDNVPKQVIEGAFHLAKAYFDGKEQNIVPSLPKPPVKTDANKEKPRDKDKLRDIEIYLKTFMLFSRNIAMYKLSSGSLCVYPSTDEFKRICIRMSAKRAIAYYELFEGALNMFLSNANLNALYSYLSEKT